VICLREEENTLLKCDIHDARYDPAEGCPDCQRELRDSEHRGGLGPWASFIAVLFIAAAIGVWYYRTGEWSSSGDYWNSQAEGDAPRVPASKAIAEPEATSPEVADFGRLDPEPYRERIESLESILYNMDPSDLETADRAATEANKLSIQLHRGNSSLIHRQAGGALLIFSGQIGSQSDTGYATLDLPRTRKQWENLRNSLFTHAGWFRQSNSRIAQQNPRSPRIDNRLVDQLHQVAGKVESLIGEGRLEAERFGEPYVDAPARSSDLDVLVRQWQNWSRNWSQSVDRVGDGMPGQPASDSDVRLLKAYNNLNSALQNLAALPHAANDSGVPFRRSRQKRFDQASLLTRESQQLLSILQQ
jgi:hypothetical protein